MTSIVYGPVAGGGGRWKTFYDVDYAALPNQNLFPDGWYTIGGIPLYTNINTNDALGMAVVNGLGIRLTPKPSLSFNTSPGLTTNGSYMEQLSGNRPIRTLMYVSSITGTPNAASVCWGGFDLFPYSLNDRGSFAAIHASVSIGRPGTRYHATTAYGDAVMTTSLLDGYRYGVVEYAAGFFSGPASVRFNNSANFISATGVYVNNSWSDTTNTIHTLPGFGVAQPYGLLIQAGGLTGGNAGGVSFYVGRVIMQYIDTSEI